MPRTKRTRKKGRWGNAALLAVFFLGLGLMLYPTVSDLYNAQFQSLAIQDYTAAVAQSSDSEVEQEICDAQAYNQTLLGQSSARFSPTEQAHAAYEALLDPGGIGAMGYIEIPKINVKLTIYHGTEDAVLRTGVGHIEGSSLPVGGESTHTVLSGHRGLPSAVLFTNLDQMEEGDVFFLHVMNEILAYEVDKISIVEPEDLSALKIEEGQDLCTLITCTPYGVNSQRLLVRGRRTEYTEALTLQVRAEASILDSLYLLPFALVPILAIGLALLILSGRRGQKSPRESDRTHSRNH